MPRALVFFGRTGEARALYFKYSGQRAAEGALWLRKAW
jgi:hypothetical protein